MDSKRMFFNVQNAYDTLMAHYPDAVENASDEEKDKYTIYESSFGDILKNQNWVVMQFTGLCDKNGKEIYEGDIVIGDEGFFQPVKGVVEYGALAFSFVGKCANGDNWNYTITNPKFTQDKSVEVIGNIYETPELIERKTHEHN